MAKAERRGNPFGWIVLGALIGAMATVGVLMVVTSSVTDGYDQGPDIRTAADDAAATAAASRGRPISAAPKPEPVAPAAAPPVATVQPEAPVDAQMAEDAAAAGMTSRAPPE